MARQAPKQRYLSATDLAAMAYCDAKVLLDKTHGEAVTQQQAARRHEGNLEHARFHRDVVRHHNRKPAPCYIASRLYGLEDPRTNELRRFRNTYLMPSAAGRMLVRVYYALSPRLAAAIPAGGRLETLGIVALDIVRSLLPTSKDGTPACPVTTPIAPLRRSSG